MGAAGLLCVQLHRDPLVNCSRPTAAHSLGCTATLDADDIMLIIFVPTTKIVQYITFTCFQFLLYGFMIFIVLKT